MKKGIQDIVRELVGHIQEYFPPECAVATPNSGPIIPLRQIYGNGKAENLGGRKTYWSKLSEKEKMILLYREIIYPQNGETLRQAISGSDYQSYLHFILNSPEEGLDALTALQRFEVQQGIKMKLEDIPEIIRERISPLLGLPSEDKKRRVVSYLFSYQLTQKQL